MATCKSCHDVDMHAFFYFCDKKIKIVLDSIAYNKNCTIFNKHMSLTGGYIGVKKHYWLKNFEGTSKLMEALALVEMLSRAPELSSFSVCTIISDNDSNGRSKAQHVSNGGKLQENVEEPKFLANPSHRKRVFARAIYSLASAPVKVSKVTKGLASHLKYCYRACVKRNQKLSAEELSKKVYNILNHVMGDHTDCYAAWCYDVKATEENKVYNPPKEHRFDKGKDLVTYIKFLTNMPVSNRWLTVTIHSTVKQMRVSISHLLLLLRRSPATLVASACNHKSASLLDAVTWVTCPFFNSLLTTMGVKMTNNLSLYLKKRDKKKKRRRSYE
jgi:hypothetical protein